MGLDVLGQAEFDSLLEKAKIAVLCFGAPWCAPCKEFERACLELRDEYQQVEFAKLQVEEVPQLVEDFSIRSIPFVMIVRERTVLYAEAGGLPKSELQHLLDLALAMKGEGQDEQA